MAKEIDPKSTTRAKALPPAVNAKKSSIAKRSA